MPGNDRFRRKLMKAMQKNAFLSNRSEWRAQMDDEVLKVLQRPASLADRSTDQVQKIQKWMSRFGFTKELNKEDKLIFAKHMTNERWFDREIVLDAGSLDRFIYVLGGCVEAYAKQSDGTELVKKKIWPGNVYAMDSVFARITNVCEHTMRAAGDTSLLTMTRASYEREQQEMKKKTTWKQMQVFHGIQEGGIMGLARLSKQMTFAINETILSEGEEIRYVYIVGAGQVKVLKRLHEKTDCPENSDNKMLPLALLGKGEIFGAYELLNALRSNWKVVAHTSNVELLAIKAKHLRTLPDETKYWLSDILKMVDDFNRKLMGIQYKFHTKRQWNEPAPKQSRLWNTGGKDVSGAGGLLMGNRMRKTAKAAGRKPKKKKERRKRTAQEKAAKKEEQKLLMAKYGDVIGQGLNVAKMRPDSGSDSDESGGSGGFEF